MPSLLQRLRDWWTIQSKSAHSPEYDEAMERRMPGFRAIQAGFAQQAKDRRREEEAWWQGVVAMQEAGQIAEAEKHSLDNMDALNRFVLDPFERLGLLWAREVDRLLALGDRPGAEAAASRASWWMSNWAAGSTSGGEGTARSNAARQLDDDLRRRLGGQ
jgi:hypothetical protein